MNSKSLRLIMCITTLALLMAACSSPSATAPQATPTAGVSSLEPTPTPLPLGMVDVGGYELFFTCIGQGTPTVILEAGHDSGAGYLVKVQSGGDRSYRVCSYDRANISPSDKAPKPRTYLDIARDLHTLLVNANIAGPYILVGHSGGGMMARLFVDQYPKEVVGLVLVDSAHPDMGSRLLACLQKRPLSRKASRPGAPGSPGWWTLMDRPTGTRKGWIPGPATHKSRLPNRWEIYRWW